MTIANTLPALQFRSSSAPTSEGKATPEPKTMVERIVDNTFLGANYTASGLSGGVTGLGAYVKSVPLGAVKTAGSALKNLWKTETIGPNLKAIALVAAVPVVGAGAVLALPFAVGSGIWHGAGEVDHAQPRHFTVGDAASAGFHKTEGHLEAGFKGCLEALEEMGNEKLAAGEKPVDIPLLKTLKTVAVGAASLAIGGIAGVVSAAVATVSAAGRGVYESFADDRLGLGGKLVGAGTALVSAPIHGVSYGVGTVMGTFGQSVRETWKEDALFGGLGTAFTEAGVSLAAGLAPKTTLLEEKQS